MHENDVIVLASASPRRQELLASVGLEFETVPGDIPEEPLAWEKPLDHALRLAREKALFVSRSAPGRFFIGADTIVVLDGEIMGKPADPVEAVRMLHKLSGAAHEVITGYAIHDVKLDKTVSGTVVTTVRFKTLTTEEISAYVATGCPMDKAGAYAIQGGAAYMVKEIKGSYTNVVGLPLYEVVEGLVELGAITWRGGHVDCG